ncbi:MAG: restriction endonuclease [Planctomycetes bacterium]|nr:restriction endonuclease [Planctomycetota bacterium]
MAKKPRLTIPKLHKTASQFAVVESLHGEPTLYGVTDGKAVGTYLELKFRPYLLERFTFVEGNAASGIDFPELAVDLKTTSIRQPQSSCPFKSARQKVFGLGYSLLVFVYQKTDGHDAKTGRLDIQHVIFVDAPQTGDFQMTRGLREILGRDGNLDDIMAFMHDRNLPVDEIELRRIAEEVLAKKPEQGYLTISNALQWRLQYTRVIEQAGAVCGVLRVK